MNLSVRKATLADLEVLNQIAVDSKKHWGYPAAWMEAWSDALRIVPQHLETQSVLKLIVDGTVIGHCAVQVHETHYEVQHLWIVPQYMGKGYGKLLLGMSLWHTVEQHQPIQVVADPNAVSFYQKQGFRTVGQVESYPDGRFLPLMEFRFD